MAFIGRKPTPVPLTSSDITDGIISEAKMADDAISLTELKAGTDGELITWDASGNPVAVGAGTSGHYLKSQGAGSVPVFAAISAGKILQVQSGTVGTTTFANAGGYIGSGLSITPSSTSSKVLIFVSTYCEQTAGSAAEYASLQLHEGTTNISTIADAFMYQVDVGSRHFASHNFIRSPSSTSAVQYRVHHSNASGTGTYAYKQTTHCLMEVEG